jgi:glycosyltransferase involved in cell wall biosynthesis
MPRFSLIISAYNEANYLPRLLDTVDEARRCYRGNYDAIEIIVADNMSTNSTAQIARARDCKVAQIERRCIASVRNCGAALATAEYLCFVDADMRVHPRRSTLSRAVYIPAELSLGRPGWFWNACRQVLRLLMASSSPWFG